jgi:selenocysteine lyase/cysteine desulfurase
MLTERVHLASCSQGARSTELDASMNRMMETIAERGAPWGLWMEEVESARTLFAQYINASPDEIAIMPNASTGAFQAGSTWDFTSRHRIVTTDMEFPSIAHVWLALAPRGAVVDFAPEIDGFTDVEQYAPLIDERTKLVSIPLASFKNGAALPVAEVVDHAHRAGALVFVDAYQAAGVIPIDVKAMECDFLVAGTLKYLLGLPGMAFLYVRGGLPAEVEPQLTGWFGRVDPFAFDPRGLDFPRHARRLESGTPSIPSAYAANAGMRVLARIDKETAWEAIRSMVTEVSDSLTDIGYKSYSPALESRRGPQVAVRTEDPARLGAFLSEREIFASPRGDVVRLSFHYYNNRTDVDACIRALDEYRRA